MTKSLPKIALITGCSSGIGLATTKTLLDAGCAVIGMSRRAPDLEHPSFRHIAVDLTKAEDLDAALLGIGALDVLVHAAGVLRVGSHDALLLDDGALMWRLHVECAARLVKALTPDMPDGARIVFVGSRVASGAPSKALYAASKSALIGLARSFASELTARQITVNIVAPGATDTPMLRDPERSIETPKVPPFGRFIQSDEIAGTIAFLVSPAAASITGQQLVVCGGASL